MSAYRCTPARMAGVVLLMTGGLAISGNATAQTAGGPEPTTQAATNPAAAEARTISFDIPAQNLGAALAEFGRQSEQELFYAPEAVAGKTATAVSGTMSRAEAIVLLLRGTGLEYLQVPDGGVMIGDPTSMETYKARLRERSSEATGTFPEGAVVATAVGAGEIRTPQSVTNTQRDGIEEIIVTGQKKEERLQDVPIAISAFSSEQLDAQKIEGGFDLLKAVPNVTFSKSNYSSYNFSIRGVGTKAVSATADPGVAISFNNVPLIRNRLFEQEYFDVERVEVLRGPQGTLYGRNATGGVVNMITNKPVFNEFSGDVKAEVGNYDARRMTGMINVPLVDDTLALRVAGSMTQRQGYGTNLTTGEASDNRDLWSSRVTLAFHPSERIRTNLIWEYFNEEDRRLRTGKQLCHRDEGPETITDGEQVLTLDEFGRGRINQGCKIGSLYDRNAFGKPNGWALPFTYLMSSELFRFGFTGPLTDPDTTFASLIRRDRNPYGSGLQSTDLRAIESIIEPEYRAEANIFAFDVDVDLTDTLMFSSQTAYNEDNVWSLQDYMRFSTPAVFTDSDEVYGLNGIKGDTFVRTPGGIYNDPQIGPSDTLKGFEVSSSESVQFSQEFRLQSDFDGPLNFSVGANYLRFKGNNDYFLFFNVVTLLAENYYNAGEAYNPAKTNGVYVDYSPFSSLAGDGHNYFRNQNPYYLESRSMFGELYWQAADALKITAGLRYTNDRKKFTPWPSHLLVGNDIGRYGPEAPINLGWTELTGRLGFDWTPVVPFTDQTMVYGFYSRGYKGGGANPPPAKNAQSFLQAVVPAVFDPEYVDAFEVGAKNTLLGSRLMLNGTAFFYDYQDYQVSKVQDRTVINENFDAKVWGAELEILWRPVNPMTLNAAIGHLRTQIGNGERSLDIFNRTQNRPGWHTVSPWVQQTSNCILPEPFLVGRVLSARDRGVDDGGDMMLACLDFWGTPDLAQYPDTAEANEGQGFLADIGGNELPNSPRWTLSLGADYTWPMPQGWAMTLRGDYYRQTESWSRVYAEVSDRLQAWDSANFSLTFAQPDRNVTLQVYVKNAFDETPITDAFLNSDSTGMTTNIFTLDPRLVGLSIRVGF